MSLFGRIIYVFLLLLGLYPVSGKAQSASQAAAPESPSLVAPLDLNTTLTNICSSKTVQDFVRTVIDPNLGQQARYDQLFQRRLDLRHAIAVDAVRRSRKLTEGLLPLLSMGQDPKLQDAKSVRRPNAVSILAPSCDYLESNDPTAGEEHRLSVDRLQNLQNSFSAFKGRIADFAFHKESETLFSFLVKLSYERNLVLNLDKLFGNSDLQFGIKMPKKMHFPAIYPENPLFDPAAVSFPLQRSKEIDSMFPILGRPSSFVAGKRFFPTETLAEDIFEALFKTSDWGWGLDTFWTEGNGKQDESPQNGFRIARSMQWMRGKVQKIAKGSPILLQLSSDLKPFLQKWLKVTMDVETVEFYRFLADYQLMLPGEGQGKISDGLVVVDDYSKFSIAQRRLLAAWQLFLRFDLTNLLAKVSDRAVSSSPASVTKVKRLVFQVAKSWQREINGATASICKAKSKKNLEFLEEHPTAVAHFMMAHSQEVQDKGFLKRVDGFCHSGTVKPVSSFNIDKHFHKPWGITRRVQAQNVLMSTSVVALIGGSLAIGGPGALPTIGQYSYYTSVVSGTLGAILKTNHVLTKLAFDSALTNPNKSYRQREHAGALYHAITIPLYAFGFHYAKEYIAKEGLGKFLLPPGRNLLARLGAGVASPRGTSFGVAGFKTQLQWLSHSFNQIVGNWQHLAAHDPGFLMKEGMQLVAFSRFFTAVGITSQKFREIGVNPMTTSAFWTDTFQTYLESALTANLLTDANSFKGWFKLFAFTQAETFLVESFMKHSMSLMKGKLPDARYLEWTLKWKVTKELTFKPIRIFSFHGIKAIAGKSPMGYILTASLWDYLLYGYPYSNMINSVIADFNTNKDVGYVEAWKRLNFRDFHLNETGSLACTDCAVNSHDQRDILKKGILNYDDDIFESLIYLKDHYREENSGNPQLDALTQIRLHLFDTSRSSLK